MPSTQNLRCSHWNVAAPFLALQDSGMNHRQNLPHHFPSLNLVPPTSIGGPSTGNFGHGFLIASDNLTKHPFGPGTQPEMMSTTPTFADGIRPEHTPEHHYPLLLIHFHHLRVLGGDLVPTHATRHLLSGQNS